MQDNNAIIHRCMDYNVWLHNLMKTIYKYEKRKQQSKNKRETQIIYSYVQFDT